MTAALTTEVATEGLISQQVWWYGDDGAWAPLSVRPLLPDVDSQAETACD